MQGVHFHCVRLVRPKVLTTSITIKTSCEASTKDGEQPYTLPMAL